MTPAHLYTNFINYYNLLKQVIFKDILSFIIIFNNKYTALIKINYLDI